MASGVLPNRSIGKRDSDLHWLRVRTSFLLTRCHNGSFGVIYTLIFTAKNEDDEELNNKNAVELNIKLKTDLTN